MTAVRNISISVLKVKFPFALTVFVSAFLLFLVQPLIAKAILPWFGGGPGVWTTAMLFFQAVLLAGYMYTYLIIRFLDSRTQMMLHICLMLAAVLLLPLTPSEAWKPDGSGYPEVRILLLLAATVGLQYFMLATTAPLVQAWFSRVIPGYSTYRLYALSNVGSIIALASYPFVVEPALTLHTQEELWSWGFVIYVTGCSYVAVKQWKDAAKNAGHRASREAGRAGIAGPARGDRFFWVALSATGSIMLLAVTNHVCQDIAVVPFLWVAPLSLYLLTFAICFDREKWYFRGVFAVLFILAVTALGVTPQYLPAVLDSLGLHALEIKLEILIFFAGLFVICMVMHGELARLKPHSGYLTSYYLMIALGGMIGGLFVALAAPVLFDIYLELQIGIVAACLLAMAAWYRDGNWGLAHGRPRWIWILLLAGFAILTGYLQRDMIDLLARPIIVTRNFYGVVRVTERFTGNTYQHRYLLQQSGMTEGLQFAAPSRRHLATAYYGPSSGVGLALKAYRESASLRIGAIGLGVGTVAAYGRFGDYFRFYDINPEIVGLAENFFTYLNDSMADTDIVVGDARISLEREPDQEFDILILDAFSGDAIPVHLLTKEAFEIYLRHLKPEGVLAVHTSNQSLDLTPVVLKLAEYFGLEIVSLRNGLQPRVGVLWSEWFLLTHNRKIIENPSVRAAAARQEAVLRNKAEKYANFRMWTDNYSNLFQVMYDR